MQKADEWAAKIFEDENALEGHQVLFCVYVLITPYFLDMFKFNTCVQREHIAENSNLESKSKTRFVIDIDFSTPQCL